VRLTAVVAVGWMLSVTALYLSAPATLIRLFAAQGDSRLVVVGTTMLMLSAVWQLFDGIGITLSEALRAAGDTTWCAGARVVLAWAVFLPLAWVSVLIRGGGVVSMMVVLVTYLALLALALALRFASGRWRDIQLVEPDVTGEPPPVAE
jgi:MATE family multidrug resistance protein